MKININNDFLKEYKNDFWKGFSMTDIVHIAEGFLCAGAVVAGLVLGFKIPITIAIYCAVPVAAPVIFIGFYKYQGYLSVKELVKEYMYTGNTKRLLYESEETEPDRKFQIIRNINNKDKAKRKRKGA